MAMHKALEELCLKTEKGVTATFYNQNSVVHAANVVVVLWNITNNKVCCYGP